MARESGLSAVGGGQVMRRRCDIHCVPSYNFIEADLRSIVRPRWTVEVSVCVRARMCARACRARDAVTYLQMALGYDELSPHNALVN